MVQLLKEIDKFLLLNFARIIIFLIAISVLFAGIALLFALPIIFFVNITNQEWLLALKDLLYWLVVLYWSRVWLKIAPYMDKMENIFR